MAVVKELGADSSIYSVPLLQKERRTQAVALTLSLVSCDKCTSPNAPEGALALYPRVCSQLNALALALGNAGEVEVEVFSKEFHY